MQDFCRLVLGYSVGAEKLEASTRQRPTPISTEAFFHEPKPSKPFFDTLRCLQFKRSQSCGLSSSESVGGAELCTFPDSWCRVWNQFNRVLGLVHYNDC